MNCKQLSSVFELNELDSEIILEKIPLDLDFALEKATELVDLASVAIMEIYKKPYTIEVKEDNTPVTEADLLANKIITEGLEKFFSEHSILSEETEDNLDRLNNDFCWIIDPIDGTKGFIQKCGQFIVNLALSYKGEIIIGVVAAPAFGDLYFAVKGQGAYLRNKTGKIKRIYTSSRINNLILYTHNPKNSNMGYLKLLNYFGENVTKTIESHSRIKGCWIASGEGDVYASTAPMKEWDIAPEVLLVEEAGGHIRYANHEKLQFNQEDPHLKYGIYIVNNKNNIPKLENYNIQK